MSGTQPNPNESNSYSYFFREPDVIEMIRTHVLLPSVALQHAVSIWCVGCATGDEAYSLAIVAQEVKAKVNLLATDINRDALQQAREARYAPRSLRHVSLARRHRWFVDEGMTQVIVPELRRQVTFVEHDIVNDAPPEPYCWDLILCRNVLLYLDEDEIKQAISSIIDVLAPRGMLILGGAESMGLGRRRWPSGRPRLDLLDIDGVLVYSKLALSVEEGPTSSDVDHPTQSAAQVVDESSASATERDRFPSLEEDLQEEDDDPFYPSVSGLRERGDAMLDQGNNDGALLCYVEASALSPLDADLYLRLGLCHLLIDDTQAARTDLRKALFLDANLWQAAWLLGDLLADEDPPAAAPYFVRVCELLDRRKQRAPATDEVVLQPFLPGRRVALEAARARLRRISRPLADSVSRYDRLQLRKVGR